MDYFKNFWGKGNKVGEGTNKLREEKKKLKDEKEKKITNPEFIKKQIIRLDKYCFKIILKIIKECAIFNSINIIKENSFNEFTIVNLINTLNSKIAMAYDNIEKNNSNINYNLYYYLYPNHGYLGEFKEKLQINQNPNINKDYKEILNVIYNCGSSCFGKLYNHLDDIIKNIRLFHIINVNDNKKIKLKCYDDIYDNYIKNNLNINYSNIQFYQDSDPYSITLKKSETILFHDMNNHPSIINHGNIINGFNNSNNTLTNSNIDDNSNDTSTNNNTNNNSNNQYTNSYNKSISIIGISLLSFTGLVLFNKYNRPEESFSYIKEIPKFFRILLELWRGRNIK